MKMNDVAKKLKDNDSFLIFTHLNPDGDALGSASALALMLRKAGKTADVVLEKEISGKYSFMQEYLAFKTPEICGKYDCAVAVDVADEARLGVCRELFFSFDNKINIDHHMTNTCFADVNLIEQRPATGEIVFDIIQALGTELTKAAAECLYIAICTDTGRFSYSGTDAHTFNAAAKIADAGADISTICAKVYASKSQASVRLLTKALGTLKLYSEGRIAALYTKFEDIFAERADESDCEDFINYARDINGVEIAVFVRENANGNCKVSMRSKYYADVAAMAKSYGGGGHMRAAGFTVEGEPHVIAADIAKKAEQLL